MGIFYEDIYHLVRPFHEHRQHLRNSEPEHNHETGESSVTAGKRTGEDHTDHSLRSALSVPTSETALISENLSIPPVNSYGSTELSKSRSAKTLKHVSSNVSVASSSDSSIREPLLPADLKLPDSNPSPDLIPFWSFFLQIGRSKFMIHTRSDFSSVFINLLTRVSS